MKMASWFRQQRAATVPKAKMSPPMSCRLPACQNNFPDQHRRFSRCAVKCIWIGVIFWRSTQRRKRMGKRFLPIRAMRRQDHFGRKMPALPASAICNFLPIRWAKQAPPSPKPIGRFWRRFVISDFRSMIYRVDAMMLLICCPPIR